MEPELLIRLAACNLSSAYCIGRTCSEPLKYTVPCLQLSFICFLIFLVQKRTNKKKTNGLNLKVQVVLKRAEQSSGILIFWLIIVRRGILICY